MRDVEMSVEKLDDPHYLMTNLDVACLKVNSNYYNVYKKYESVVSAIPFIEFQNLPKYYNFCCNNLYLSNVENFCKNKNRKARVTFTNSDFLST